MTGHRGAALLRGVSAVGLALGLPVVLFALWWLASADSTNIFLPPLRRIVEAFGQVWLSDVFVRDVLPSLRRLAIGYAAALVVGVGVGYVIGRWSLIRALTSPILAFFRVLPAPVMIPVLLVAVGIGDATKLIVIALGAVWPILLNTADGVRGVDDVQLETAAAYRLPSWTRHGLILRAATPQVFAGARQALGISLIVMVVSEMLMSTDGLGFTVIRFQRTFAIPQMWSGVLLLGVLGFGLAKIFELIERRALRWHQGATGREESW
ncbi:ABC transporter permease [Micromonospora endophytica]|uniref:Nitrate ABC transporter permease n=1 Tax=Micromonospora endophytica TaxID=515350 RepID=A0A2W2CMH1_9ACTN|nr:ABC transporter permease subunit [Micromonospora endophytica]PZG00636.1 nitrate ABC transporter permease [Micromonospora endophytica]RIW51462.1 ABC transporter permease subunit [Micromonospora endophytica]BCJ62188.1 nitrate ABC transporter permease [Micromonospora endophytica]